MHYTQTRKHLCPPNYCVSILPFKPTLHSKGQCMMQMCAMKKGDESQCVGCWGPSLTFGWEGSIDENWWTSQDSLKMWFCFSCMETLVSIFWYHQILQNSPPMETFGNWQMLYKFTKLWPKPKVSFFLSFWTSHQWRIFFFNPCLANFHHCDFFCFSNWGKINCVLRFLVAMNWK